ncbi:MAG: RT0821/Lpp0805 family surface protein [Rhodoferax sp.]
MKIIHLTLAIAALLPFAEAPAATMGYLKDSPMGKFNEEDFSLFQQASKKALNEAVDGETVDWKNTSTGSSGSISPLKSFERGGLKCRSVRVRNQHKSLRGNQTSNMCLQADGDWKIAK